MDSKLQTHALNTILCGSSFIKATWNPKRGDIIVKRPDSEFLELNNDGSEVLEEVFQGDIDTVVKSPFSVLASPGATTVENATWIMDRTHITTRDLLSIYPDLDLNKIKIETQLTEYERFVNRLQSPIFSTTAGYEMSRFEKSTQVRDHEVLLVKEFWMKPNDIYPEGVVATVVGDQLIGFNPFPTELNGEYPIIKTDDKENPFAFYGQSTVTRLVPVQRRYNKGRTQTTKNAALMANVKWWAPKGHGMHDDALTDEEGEVVESNPNLPRPQQLAVSPIPNYVIESMLQDITDIRDIGGEREPSQLPFPNLTAGVALETAAELADTMIMPTIRGLEQGLIKVGRFWLLYAQENYLDPRTIKILGEGSKVQVTSVKSTDLLHQTDVTIQLESYLGYSKAAQQQKLLDMWDRRIISDPKVFMRAFVTGDIDLVLKEDEGTENIVLEDIEAIKNGKQPAVLPFDDHPAYVRTLSKFIQTPEFRRMPPDRQQLAMAVLQQHLQFLQPQQEEDQNPAAVNTPFGQQVTEGPEQGG
jgi:hypothetical protein